MGLLGGIVRAVTNPVSIAQLAMGPAGWASLAMQTVGRSLLSEVIGQVGARMGLPPAMVSLAQQTFAGPGGVPAGLDQAINTLGQRMGSSMTEIGATQRQARSLVDQLVQNVMDNAINGNNSVGDAANTRASARGKGASWLERLAAVMSEVVEGKMQDLERLAKTAKDGATETNAFQVASQEFNLLMNTTTTTIKSIGEALGNMARKQ